MAKFDGQLADVHLKKSSLAPSTSFPPFVGRRGVKRKERGHQTPPTRLRLPQRMPSISERELSPQGHILSVPGILDDLPLRGQIPSFMNALVDGVESASSATPEGDAAAKEKLASPATHQNRLMAHHGVCHINHQHCGSGSTCVSFDSTNSSPTTTISTVDSSSLTDSSPGSSPESPTSNATLPSLVPKSINVHAAGQPFLNPPLTPLTPGFGQSGSLSPGKKPRNTKNLSLNMASPARPLPSPGLGLHIKTAAETDSLQSAPASPTFTMPARPPKHRPSKLGLTIQTSATSRSSAEGSKEVKVVPPTPSSARPNMLRHHQSSPALSLFSPTAGIPGGMQLPPPKPQRYAHSSQSSMHSFTHSYHSSFDSVHSISEQASPVSSRRVEDPEDDDEYAVPLSKEVKSPAYPSGPVCIYDPHVYLYLEPNDHEASQFDVILNVAREVKNPFEVLTRAGSPTARVAAEVKTMVIADSDITPPSNPPAHDDSKTAVDAHPVPEITSTSEPETAQNRQGPEYIHIPWDHNSNIVDDLLDLVEVIDDRVRQGKRVLIHCQCGVSRSASLTVAYGIFKNPSLTVQEVYDAVKKKSRWIGPNMSLIYQLSEFRTKMLQRHGLAQPGFRSWRAAGGKNGLSGTGRANTLPTDPASGPSMFSVASFDSRRSDPQPAPQTAPLPEERDRTASRNSGSGPEPALKPVTVHQHAVVTPGPSSAPSGLTWNSATPPASIYDGPRSTSPLSSNPKAAKITAIPPPPSIGGAAEDSTARVDVPPAPAQAGDGTGISGPAASLMSPRASTFTINPLHDPPVNTLFGFRTGITGRSTFVDPRSPVLRGEAPIVRSIFDVL